VGLGLDMDGYWKIEIPRWWLLTGETKPERELPRGILVRLGHGQGDFIPRALATAKTRAVREQAVRQEWAVSECLYRLKEG